jgi:hypothetical protein
MRGVKWTGEFEERAKASTSEPGYHVYAKVIVHLLPIKRSR